MKLLPFIWLGAETAKKPNVVLILTDDLGMGDISVRLIFFIFDLLPN